MLGSVQKNPRWYGLPTALNKMMGRPTAMKQRRSINSPLPVAAMMWTNALNIQPVPRARMALGRKPKVASPAIMRAWMLSVIKKRVVGRSCVVCSHWNAGSGRDLCGWIWRRTRTRKKCKFCSQGCRRWWVNTRTKTHFVTFTTGRKQRNKKVVNHSVSQQKLGSKQCEATRKSIAPCEDRK